MMDDHAEEKESALEVHNLDMEEQVRLLQEEADLQDAKLEEEAENWSK